MTRLTLTFLGLLFANLPEPLVRVIAAGLGEAIFLVLHERRRIILSNLSHAFPDRSHRALVRLARASCRRTLEAGLLALAYPKLSEARIRRIVGLGESLRVKLPGLLGSKRPIVACAVHVGAWEITTTIPLFLGRDREFGAVYRPLRHPKLNAWLLETREKHGVRMLSRREGFMEGMRILRNGGVFVVLFDQNAGDLGVLSLFFDRVCSTTNLPGMLTERYDAAAIFHYTRRHGFWRYTIEASLDEEAPRETAALTAWLNQQLEDLLRRDDELCATWLWLHNRWKTQHTPERRLRLEAKRSILEPGAPLPRRTRFVVRLPDDLARARVALPLIQTLRESRPDAELTLIGNRDVAPLLERSGLGEHVVALPRWGISWLLHCRRLRRRYPDCWISFHDSLSADLEAWLSACPQRFGVVHPGDFRPLLTHGWRYPAGRDGSLEQQTRIWYEFLRHFGLRSEPEAAPVAASEPSLALGSQPA